MILEMLGDMPVAVGGRDQFLSAFIRCYGECRDLYSDQEFATDVWPRWDSFFFRCKRSEALRSESVISKVAFALGLEYWDGEPLRLDGVLYSKEEVVERGFPFPIMVAFEHEEDPRGFQNEIMKLLSVRCPLKVGITHTITERTGPNFLERLADHRDTIRTKIAEKFRRIEAVNREDPRTEYLFLIGCQERQKDPVWYFLSFTAGSGPGDQNFERIEEC